MKKVTDLGRLAVRHAVLAGLIAAYAGCVSDVGDDADTERVAAASQEVVGARCGTGYPPCGLYETCCWEFFMHSYCRNLYTDPDNCGECGFECDSTDICAGGECHYFGK